MYSYRHAFHAGNHADVLKHSMLVAVLGHMTVKDTALTVIDTHAGAGLYRLDGDYATTSGEASTGILAILDALHAGGQTARPLPPLLTDYLAEIGRFNPKGGATVYPGSPALSAQILRDSARDRLRLFEMHPTDSEALAGNLAQIAPTRMVSVTRKDGFEGLKALLPPPGRRALVLIDPSYEIKTDYRKVPACIQDSLVRFATGTYLVWYPIIARPEAHELPRRLKTLSSQAGRGWLHATLNIGHGPAKSAPGDGGPVRHGLTASGVFVVNPPHPLRAALSVALPQLVSLLGQGRGQGFTLDAAGPAGKAA